MSNPRLQNDNILILILKNCKTSTSWTRMEKPSSVGQYFSLVNIFIIFLIITVMTIHEIQKYEQVNKKEVGFNH